MFLVLMAFVVGAVLLLVVVNYVVSVIRRIRRGYFGADDDEVYSATDDTRRRSSQYNFRRTTYSTGSADPRARQSRQQPYRKEQGSGYGRKEVIVDTRDPHTANRQIIPDDEGEYVDFVEEK